MNKDTFIRRFFEITVVAAFAFAVIFYFLDAKSHSRLEQEAVGEASDSTHEAVERAVDALDVSFTE